MLYYICILHVIASYIHKTFILACINSERDMIFKNEINWEADKRVLQCQYNSL